MTKVAKRARRRSGARRRKGARRSGNITLRRVRGKVYRSNPGGLVKVAVQGAKDAALVMGGGAATRAIVNMLPLDDKSKSGLMGAAVATGAVIGVSMAARRFLGADSARMVVAGGMIVPVKAMLTQFVPSLGPLLGDYDGFGAYLDPMGSYPALAGTDASEYVADDMVGSYPDGSY